MSVQKMTVNSEQCTTYTVLSVLCTVIFCVQFVCIFVYSVNCTIYICDHDKAKIIKISNL